jgi:hypothetical protein
MIYSIITSLIFGIISGILYGLLYATKAHPFLLKNPHLSFISTVLRLGGVALFFLYLLRRPTIHPILVLLPFFACFWGVIIKKANAHECNRI